MTTTHGLPLMHVTDVPNYCASNPGVFVAIVGPSSSRAQYLWQALLAILPMDADIDVRRVHGEEFAAWPNGAGAAIWTIPATGSGHGPVIDAIVYGDDEVDPAIAAQLLPATLTSTRRPAVPAVPTDYDFHQGRALQILRTAEVDDDVPVAQVHATLALAAAVHDRPITVREYSEPINLVPVDTDVVVETPAQTLDGIRVLDELTEVLGRHGFLIAQGGDCLADDLLDVVIRHMGVEPTAADFPPVVCLCGSTRFVDEFNAQRVALARAGQIVLSIEIVTTQAADDDPQHVDPEMKANLDALHLRKIDLADYVLVLNVGGYIGESTSREVAYAIANGKPVRFLEPVSDIAPEVQS